jgi:hypothetical protein
MGTTSTKTTPKRPIKVPVISFLVGRSLKNRNEKNMIKIGAEEIIRDAFIDGAFKSPWKKK